MTGSLQEKNNKFYAVLNFKDSNGKRVQKWISLNLPVKGNKRKAEAMLNDLLVQYQFVGHRAMLGTILEFQFSVFLSMCHTKTVLDL